jgi:acetylornithine deacetylase/succinyl-diaminopimelate desuccinylase-like protein
MTSLKSLQDIYKTNKDKALQDFFTFLKFETIGTDTKFAPQMTQCSNWLAKYLRDMGFFVELWETETYPIIFASHLNAGPDKPTLLIYNHYDVQPVDPLEDWISPPFEPTIRNGQIYARGAQDNKGQCFYVLQALKGLLERDKRLPINIKLCIEGEEESGSVQIANIIESKKEELKADYLAVVDVGIPGPQAPAVTLGVRGIVTFEMHATGSNIDLHSGYHGGVVYNPLHAIVEMFAKARDAEGRITIPGFYDDVAHVEKTDEFNLKFDSKQFEETFAAHATGGEKLFTPLERRMMRPTLEINGISGGYAGVGFKTVIPATATAKFSCRLVPNQSPYKIAKLVAEYFQNIAPEGIEIKVEILPGGGWASRVGASSPLVEAFSKAYEEVYNAPCEKILNGGSIPISTALCKVSGASLIFVGLGLNDDAIHAPNEHFGVDRLEKGYLMIARAIENLAEYKSETHG